LRWPNAPPFSTGNGYLFFLPDYFDSGWSSVE